MKQREAWFELAESYIQFQNRCLSPFHAVERVASDLQEEGFQFLDIHKEWNLDLNGRYFLPHHDGKSLLAFILGEKAPVEHGFNIACAHTDSPVLRLRLRPWDSDQGQVRLLSQVHGGLIARTWLDRPLKLAGAVYNLVRKNKSVDYDSKSLLPKLARQLVQSERAIGLIPDIAIHLDRNKNSEGEINLETMLTACCGMSHDKDLAKIKKQFWQELGLKGGEPDGFELSFSPFDEHAFVGLNDDFIVGPRHDDLAMVFAIYKALKDTPVQAKRMKTSIVGFFDAEETGSQTCSGAASSFLRDALTRIIRHHPAGGDLKDLERAFAQSYLISADMAHAFHPAHANKYDAHHKININAGLVIKENANDRYATSGASATIFRGLCEAAEVPVQEYINRQDLGCGSTIGPTLAAQLNCHTVDVGAAMWAMHSTGESMGSRDLLYAKQLFQTFFKS